MKSVAALSLTLTLVSSIALAGDADWPQWRGPNRDGHAAPQELLQQWPQGGPPLEWSATDLGTGYSAVSVVDGRLFTLGTINEKCVVICLNAEDGTMLWQTPIGRAGKSGDYNTGWGAGQRSTPTVDAGQVFVVSDVGTVAALEAETGKMQWSAELVGDFGGKIPTWGYSDSPLIDGNRVIVTPGESQFLVGLDRNSGEQVWGSKGVSAPAQYVSVMKASVGNKTFYVTASKPGLFAFDVETGEKLWDDTATGNKVAVIPTPILQGNRLYHTSAYQAGNTLLELKQTPDGNVTFDSIYTLNSKSMQNHHGGVVLVDNTLYGFTNVSRGNWMAQDFATGNTLWQEKINNNRSGSITYADGRLYCYNDKDGTVVLVEPNRDEFRKKGELALPSQTKIPRDKGAIWAHPVVANGLLIIRDQDLMYAFNIRR